MNKGLFEPTVMFFRMCNSPATFQAMMDDIFMTMIDNQLVIVYMDDILIFADTKEELDNETGIGKTTRTQPLPKSQEMRILSNKN
jgi:Reverse transcriptase (RNA-dependent DNA polymerase)